MRPVASFSRSVIIEAKKKVLEEAKKYSFGNTL